MNLAGNLGIKQHELDDAINNIPNSPSRLLSDPNLFKTKNLRTTTVDLEVVEGELQLIPNSHRDDPRNIKTYGKKSTIRHFSPLHLNLLTPISANQLQDVRKLGTTALITNSDAITDELIEHRAAHDLTLEVYMLNAIKGKLIDLTNNKIELDLFKEFGITEPKTTLELTTKTTKVGTLLEQIVRNMRKELRGDTSTGVTVLCSPEFFDALVSHQSVEAAWEKYENNSLARENTNGKFVHKGINFEVYDFSIDDKPLIEAGHAHAFLNGMQRGFVRYNAPATFISQTNTTAKPFYARVVPDPDGLERSIRVYTETNPLPVCLKPKTLMHLTMS